MTSHIIGISGNMGAGKSTLTRALAKEWHSTFLMWDDFDAISTGPEDYIDWYKRGENYTEWNYQKLADILESLKMEQPIVHPTLQITLNPTKYIIFDAPLGRFHTQTGMYIDTWVHLDVPLDVSLCRWLLRNYKETNRTKDELISEIDFYLNNSRPLFDDTKFKTEADIIIDGMLSTELQVKSIEKYIMNEKL
ncbi:AAA family ATPase [Legionella shakespearei]|uniref:Uridine kinase n=1 Tax=Legionella shakespearei DSM 23087 TaxID=1122169 RepID=A0A0W0YWI7_9GAMM|nr:AAA family ATPase [Legionella shakespearei]KTD60931.1 uridine kinase [Legionella shakespearei DSM 23087]